MLRDTWVRRVTQFTQCLTALPPAQTDKQTESVRQAQKTGRHTGGQTDTINVLLGRQTVSDRHTEAYCEGYIPVQDYWLAPEAAVITDCVWCRLIAPLKRGLIAQQPLPCCINKALPGLENLPGDGGVFGGDAVPM